MPKQPGETGRGVPREIAPGVHCLDVGRGFLRSNVFFVRSGSAWSLIDAGSAGCGAAIHAAAGLLYGKDAPPVSILLTHGHPDHAGAARELAGMWDCPVLVHPDELPLVAGDITTVRKYANPLDRWLILPMFHLIGPKRSEAISLRESWKDVARPFDAGAGLPGLPDWEAVHAPGHTPGSVAFFRRSDRVLIAGDALVTMPLNSPWGLLLRRQEVSGSPWIATWDWRMARVSVAILARLEPHVLAGGHGIPMTGLETAERVRAFAAGL